MLDRNSEMWHWAQDGKWEKQMTRHQVGHPCSGVGSATEKKNREKVVALGVGEGVAGSTFNRQTIVRFLEP